VLQPGHRAVTERRLGAPGPQRGPVQLESFAVVGAQWMLIVTLPPLEALAAALLLEQAARLGPCRQRANGKLTVAVAVWLGKSLAVATSVITLGATAGTV
jgi:hypothetical protein